MNNNGNFKLPNSSSRHKINNLLNKFKSNSLAELEFVIHFDNVDPILYNSIFTKLNNISDHISIIKNVNIMSNKKHHIYTTYKKIIDFSNPSNPSNVHCIEKKSLIKPLKFNSILKHITYKLNLKEEKPITSFNTKISFVRIKLRFSFSIPNFPNWKIDLDLIKQFKKYDEHIINEFSNNIFNHVDSPFEFIDYMSLEIEYIGDKNNLNYSNIFNCFNFIVKNIF